MDLGVTMRVDALKRRAHVVETPLARPGTSRASEKRLRMDRLMSYRRALAFFLLIGLVASGAQVCAVAQAAHAAVTASADTIEESSICHAIEVAPVDRAQTDARVRIVPDLPSGPGIAMNRHLQSRPDRQDWTPPKVFPAPTSLYMIDRVVLII